MPRKRPAHDTDPPVSLEPRWWTRWSLSAQILLGLLLGVSAGLFFGEMCGPLSIVGDAFVGLLQMTVLPYIVVSLVASLGRLSLGNSQRLVKIGGAVLVVLWAITLGVVAILPSVFPDWRSGSFFSTAMIETPAEVGLVSYFIPANIFSALAANHVPAIVLFSLCVGLTLSKVPQREKLLDLLDICAAALIRISSLVTRLAPIGIFAIAASTAGTLSLNEVSRLQVYLVAYTGGAVFMTFLVMPLLVSTLTPFSYRDVMHVVKEPMLTAFATGKLMIVLPMLIDNTERLLRHHPIDNGSGQSPPSSALYGVAYAFPHVGKLLSLLFIFFAAWFVGTPIKASAYPSLLSSGLFAYFGGPIVAIPYLLDRMHLPHDMFQLFLVSGVYGERVGDAVGAMHLCTLSLLSIAGLNHAIQFQPLRLGKGALAVAVSGILILFATGAALKHFVAAAEDRADMLGRIQLLERPVENVVIGDPGPNPEPLLPNESLLERIQRRGVLRVGYNEDKVPFAFFNMRHQLVGYDINMAHSLARDLGVTLEFVRFHRPTLPDQLAADHFDIVMSGLVGTFQRAQTMQHSKSYLDVNLAFAVADYRSQEISSLKAVRALRGFRIGVVDLSRDFADRVQATIPNATLVEVKRYRDFFTAKDESIDALLISAESGSAFTLMYPHYEVVIPEGLKVQLPLFYGIAHQDTEMRELLDHWITLRQRDGTAKEYYDHWVLGKTPTEHQPRWSIIRDVLHWID
ncbi:cation:dicarboxylate symporter family transporter [Allorhodopirellula solitaria]|uniref:Proton glutamate symport protein n=1 Tax=Allorhodopirellula solitaria TaxID=2527987 RepID=A0A5C5XX08_9BACT|nr:cation:dicarboxylase symporter family transporter [Allorhodopirellula solitaria]TWT67051.1 Proton glutamate symport protein [Allorhodopirellula solitaria]